MIRPELRRQLRQNIEPIAWAGLVLLCLWAAYAVGARGALWVVVILLGLAAVAAAGLVIALRRARLRPSGERQGIVLVDERRVGFFDPEHAGGFVDLSALLRLELRGAQEERTWVLYHEDGPPLMISQNAPGAEQLLDTFAVLPGLGIGAIARAFASEEEIVLMWERTPGAVERRLLH